MLSYYVSFAHFDQCSLILSLIECISFKEMVTGTVQTNPYRPLQWNRMMDNGRIYYIVIIASFHFLIYIFFSFLLQLFWKDFLQSFLNLIFDHVSSESQEVEIYG